MRWGQHTPPKLENVAVSWRWRTLNRPETAEHLITTSWNYYYYYYVAMSYRKGTPLVRAAALLLWLCCAGGDREREKERGSEGGLCV